jgi:hypothetical protein
MTVFQACDFCSFNLITETNRFGLGDILIPCLVSEVQKSFALEAQRKEFFRVVAFVSVIFSPKQTILILAPFFYHASFPSYRKHSHQDSDQRQFFWSVIFDPVTSLVELFWASHHSFALVSFRATEIIFTRSRKFLPCHQQTVR